MAQTSVVLEVAVQPSWDAETRLNAFTDHGTGMIDYATPLLGRGIPAFPGARAIRTMGGGRYGEGRYGSARPVAGRHGGYGSAPYGASSYGNEPDMVSVAVNVAPCFGWRKFAVKAFDEAGVEQGSPIEATVFVSSTEPEELSLFALEGHDSVTDTLTFAVA